MKKKEIQQPLYEYIAFGPTASEAADFLAKKGYVRPDNMQELRESLRAFIIENGDSGVMELAAVHPDRHLFQGMSHKSQMSEFSGLLKTLPMDGAGNHAKEDTKTVSNSIHQNLLFAGVFFISLMSLIVISQRNSN